MEKERNNNDGSSSNRRCGQIGEGEDDELSMVDVLNEEARLRADADAVLGGSDPHNCTYPQGYLKRQALYACATCSPEGNAGVCLACSYACHEGHDLYELYTKRYFACDCGNEKFGSKNCKLYSGKKGLNARNRYDQNFKGTYCSCARPYPDPEDSVEDQMIQCIMCEDWYHGRHLNTTVPEDDDFQEMVCPSCMTKNPFLWAYYVKGEVTKIEPENTKAESDFVNVEESQTDRQTPIKKEATSESTDPPQPQSEAQTSSSPDKPTDTENLKHTNSSGLKRSAETDSKQEPASKVAKLECPNGNETSDVCILKALEKRVVEHQDKATFWLDGWRNKLCKCHECMEMYKDKGIEFLVDEHDTVQAYESQGRNGEDSAAEEVNEASALAGMNRVTQIEMVRGFMDLKSELNEFLQDFAREGKVVKETDIREFFERMNKKRRQQVQLPRSSCR